MLQYQLSLTGLQKGGKARLIASPFFMPINLLTSRFIMLNKYSTGKNIVIFLLIQFILQAILIYLAYEFKNYSTGLQILDLKVGYDAQYAKELLAAAGGKGRELYLYRFIPLDTVFPIVYSIAYSSLLTYLFKKGFSAQNRIHKLAIAPFFIGICDYIENLGILAMLLAYPDFSYNLATFIGIFSFSKHILTIATIVLLLGGIARLLIRTNLKNNL